jgi:hypothetical protein
VEQRREPMDKIADRRHTVPDERAYDREVHIHQGCRL